MEHGQLGEGERVVPEGGRPLDPSRVGRLRAADLALPLLLCLLALGLRLWRLDALPLWVDESFTWSDYRQPLERVLGARINVHPPLYGLLMWFCMPIGGESEWSLRVPSALLSTLAVPALWALGWRIGGRWTAALAGLLMALAPVALAYGREARMYGPLMSEAALALLVADRLAVRPTRGRWIGYVFAVTAGLLTHYTAVAAWLAAGLRLLVAVGRLGWRRVIAAQVAIGVIGAAWALQLLRNRDAWEGLVWLPWTGRTSLRNTAIDWTSAMAGLPFGPNGVPAGLGSGERLLGLAAAGLFVLALGLGVAAAARRPGPGAAVVALALVPPIAIALLDPIRQSWHVRFVLVGMPCALLLAALGATALRGRLVPVGAVFAAALVAAPLYGVRSAIEIPRDDWRAAADLIRREKATHDVALGGVLTLASYYLGPVLPVRQRPVAIGRPPEEAAKELAAAVEGAPRVWLVPRGDALMDPNDLVGTMLARQTSGRREWEVGGIPVARVELRPGPIRLGGAIRPVEAMFGGALRLTGYAGERAGETVSLSVEMQVERPLGGDFKAFAHLLDGGGRTVAQKDVLIVDQLRRTTAAMEPGTRLRLEVLIEGAQDVLAGGRTIGFGIYREGGGGERLELVPTASEHRLLLPLGPDAG